MNLKRTLTAIGAAAAIAAGPVALPADTLPQAQAAGANISNVNWGTGGPVQAITWDGRSVEVYVGQTSASRTGQIVTKVTSRVDFHVFGSGYNRCFPAGTVVSLNFVNVNVYNRLNAC